MNDQALIDKINEGLKDKVVAITNPAPRRIFFKVTTDNLLTAASWLRQELGITHLSTISGVDLGQSFELLYHFANDYCVLTLRTEIPHEKPVLPSICEVIPGAILYERNCRTCSGSLFKIFLMAAHWFCPTTGRLEIIPFARTGNMRGHQKSFREASHEF